MNVRAGSVWLFLALTAACSGSSSNDRPPRDRNDDDETPGASDGDEPSAKSDGGSSEPTPANAKDTCEEYIRCMSEVQPATAGGLVSLYGDASACWKGSSADAEACGRACQKGLDDEPRCATPTGEITYAAECTSSQDPDESFLLRYLATFTDGIRQGSRITLRPFPVGTIVYRPDEALAPQPPLLVAGDRSARSTVPFTIPVEASPTGRALEVQAAALTNLVQDGDRIRSDFELSITAPIQTISRGRCSFGTLEPGADFQIP